MNNKIIFLTVSLLSLWAVTVHGQEIRLNVITINPCDATVDNELLVHLVKDDKKFFISDSLGTFKLPETGIYELKVFDSGFYRLSDSVKLIAIKSGQNYDTLTRSTIMKGVSAACVLPPEKPGWAYLCCSKPCEGYQVDYFDNGKKKVEGQFKSGLPIGELIFYNGDGKKTEIHYYDKAGKGRLKKRETVP